MAITTIADGTAKAGREAASARYHVVVLTPDGAMPRALPSEGAILIGRDEDADLRIPDPRASRNHARLTLGTRIELEDLGSVNGTRLRDQPLLPGKAEPLRPGDAFTIGSTIVILQAGEPESEARRVWAHGYLETRLIEECARAQDRGSQFALARIHVEGTAPAAMIERVLGDQLRHGDLLAAYGPRDYEALLLECGRTGAEHVRDAIAAALTEQKIASSSGLAVFPEDGTSPQALVGRASERAVAQSVQSGPAGGIVIKSAAMRALYTLAERAAAGVSSVLITGETGAGKEILAEAVHNRSPRAAGPFLPLNCAAFSETLVESELFGHERGAFTGANQAKVGLIEAAAGGTLFLDEIGEMPLSIQAKLLRVIEARQVLRVGATRPRDVDVRFIAATNRDLEEEVAEKRFREDLYFRLGVINLAIPPLRERRDEIEPLAQMFLQRFAGPTGRRAPTLSVEALSLLQDYLWPGNIRELRNVIERALVLCSGPVLLPEHFPVEKMRRNPGTQSDAARQALPSPAMSSGKSLKQIEQQAIEDALERCCGNQTRAAELLGMPRRTFCKRLKEYEIARPRG